METSRNTAGNQRKFIEVYICLLYTSHINQRYAGMIQHFGYLSSIFRHNTTFNAVYTSKAHKYGIVPAGLMPHCFNYSEQEPCTVVEASAILISSSVGDWGKKLCKKVSVGSKMCIRDRCLSLSIVPSGLLNMFRPVSKSLIISHCPSWFSSVSSILKPSSLPHLVSCLLYTSRCV